ncbi:hypothetical protein [Lactococcus protaetiae]|uniref:Uncharacterized protein n=1 Tax=Lactococcus protaetiae TaxID=2592653 RepID=A0A514Z8A6_9LACT|nr:hypothetical protein [Lactococcus protaetiae]QDK70747.1 hypothetical protein FLP15_05745 [Lactococcus protaetiae]
MEDSRLKYLSFLEEDIQGIYRKINLISVNDGLLKNGGGAKIYDENEDYKKLVDELEKMQQEIRPIALDLFRRVLALKADWIQKGIID